MDQLPVMTVVMPVLNEERDIGRSLEGIERQDYPADKLEVIVTDGGSTDRTVEIVRSYGYRVVHNPDRLAEPGMALAASMARGELVANYAADNVFREPNWLREMARPFMENVGVMGALCRVECDPGDDPFLRYFNSDTDPFSSFFYWNASHPETFRKMYPVKKETDDYVIYRFDTRYYPLIAFAQAFVVRRSYERPPETRFDDILPVMDMLAKGHDIAYVKNVTLGHYVFDNFRHYRRRMLRKCSESFVDYKHGFHVREKGLPFWRRLRQYLFVPYALSVVGPFLSALRRFLSARETFHFYHVPASWLLAVYILYFYVTVRLLGTRTTPVRDYDREVGPRNRGDVGR